MEGRKGVRTKAVFTVDSLAFALLIAGVLAAGALTAGGCRRFPKAKTQPPVAGAHLVIEGFASPESVVKDTDGRYFYVSNMGDKLDPRAKDGDGFISRLSPDGKVLDRRFLPKSGTLDSPKGMAIIGRTLYTADVDMIAGFNLDTREKVFDLDFSSEKTAFLNDLAVIDDNTLAISATDVNKVYLATLGDEPSLRLLKDNIAGANGLFYDAKNGKLFVAGFGEGFEKGENAGGRLGVLTFRDGPAQYRAISIPIGALDGIALLPDGMLLFSDWVALDSPGAIWLFDPHTGSLTALDLSRELRGPADFYFDEKTGNLWLPLMQDGKVLIEKIR